MFNKKNIIIVILVIIKSIQSDSCPDINCLSCVNSQRNNTKQSNCTYCVFGFTIVSNGTCVKPVCSDSHCKICDDSHKYCTQCVPFYSLGPIQCELQKYLVAIPIIISIIVLSLVLYSVISTCYKKYRFRNNSISNSLDRIAEIRQDIALENMQQLQGNSDSSAIQVLNVDQTQFDPSKDNCTICLENQCQLITKCNHYFHIKCFSNWMRKGNVCPLCKNDDIKQVMIILCMSCKKWKIFLKLKSKWSYLKLMRLKRKEGCKYCITQ